MSRHDDRVKWVIGHTKMESQVRWKTLKLPHSNESWETRIKQFAKDR